MVVVVEPPPLEPQPAARNTNDAVTTMRLGLRMVIVMPFRRIGRAGACAGPPPAIYEVIAPDTSSWDFAIAFCSSS